MGKKSMRKKEMCLSGNRDMWKSWRVTSCCISEICQKRLVGERQLTGSCHRGLGRIGEMICSGVRWRAVNYTGKEPGADAVLKAGPSLLHRLSTHRVAIGSRSTHLAEMGDFFFWLCHSPIQPSLVSGLRQKRWVFKTEWEWCPFKDHRLMQLLTLLNLDYTFFRLWFEGPHSHAKRRNKNTSLIFTI